ncbi:hypothetical protein [Micromonospora echinofusca]|uniref:HEAT repeat domain-containing protein n=1 Tax=Micromonospora echinofusca TaxID=47858 RepID=A0ABS3VXZ6_MICEH|nr:hypothetical protein [Micromonospora echinofusca]MBO4209378.1 HEAT repeat domain-containing protein [Micromonospora echinofusca]
MLDTLDEIDWAGLTHAYGPADDVPGQLRRLRSTDPQDRRRALGELYANIFHQGTRYEATAYAVPFLLELLADPATPDPAALIELLVAVAIGYDETWLPDALPIARFRRTAEGGAALLAAAPRPGDEGYDEDHSEYDYVESLSAEDQERLGTYVALAAYDAVRVGVPLFRSLLTHPDPAVRISAGYALAWFPEEAAGSLPALAAVHRPVGTGETATAGPAGVVATSLVATGLLGGVPDATFLADPRPAVRWAAAVGRACALGADADPGTVAELVTWTAQPPDEPGVGPDHPGGYVPFLDGDLSGYAGLALHQVGPEHTDRAYDALLSRLSSVSGREAMPVAGGAFRIAFPDGCVPEGTPFTALTVRQQRLVEVLVRSPQTWLIDGRQFGNFIGLVDGYGLPASQVALQAYLATG